MDSKDGSGSSKRPRTEARAFHKIGDSLVPLISLVDSEQASRSGTDLEIRVNEKESGAVKSPKSPHSASSLVSSSDDFFQVDPKRLPSPSASGIASFKTVRDVKPLLRDEKIDDCNDPLYGREESFDRSAASTSRVSDVTYEILLPVVTTMQSPPAQVMDRNGGYNPSRIPSSIFSGKPANPMEWSEASNESLFSIQIGNNSLSRDHGSMVGGDLYKSGELRKAEELYLSGELNRSVELINFRQVSLAAKGSDMKKSAYVEKKSRVTDEPIKNVRNGCVNYHGELNVEDPRNSSSANSQCDGSGTSVQPFAFPIKKKKKKKKCACPSCHCSNCCWPSCCRKWPSCHSKWPGCSCKWLSCQGCSCKWFSWPSCSCKCLTGCCKCPSWRSCYCKWPSCCSKCPTWPSCHCKCSTWRSCCCKCSTWPSCCCKCSTWSSCCCKCPTWPSCKCHCSGCS